MTVTEEKISSKTGAAYLYGVVRAGTIKSVSADGVGGADVAIVPSGDLAALVSFVPTTETRLRRRDLHRHLAVLEEAFAKTAVLPFRFGTAVESVDVLQNEVLTPNRADLHAAIERLEGRAQFNVKAEYVEETVLQEVVASDRGVAELRERTKQIGDAGYYDRIELGRRVAAAMERIRDDDARRILDVLSADAVDVLADDADERFALKASFLVDERRRKEFDKRLEQLAHQEQERLRFEVIGPLPPTAFAAGT